MSDPDPRLETALLLISAAWVVSRFLTFLTR